MDITRVSAVFPVIRVTSFRSKDPKSESKSKEEKNGKEFEKALNSKKLREAKKDEYN
jgi:hypothetical protein